MPEIGWILPLLLLPGVGLLIMSTSIRYNQLHDEIHHIIEIDRVPSIITEAQIRQRGRLFRNALVSLYVAVAMFVIGSMFGAILSLMDTSATEIAVVAFSCIGICCLIFASIELIRESLLSLRIFQSHMDGLMDEKEDGVHHAHWSMST